MARCYRSPCKGQRPPLEGNRPSLHLPWRRAPLKVVIALRKELSSLEDRPLSGKRIVVAEAQPPVGDLSEQLLALGADVIELPTIRIEPPSDLRAFAELVQDAHAYDWIVFSSPNGVTAFFDLFYKLYDDAREIGAARIAAIGPATARRIKDFHLKVEMQ